MNIKKCVVMNLSGIYEQQDFVYQECIDWIDLSDVKGTDGYCDSTASEIISARLEKTGAEGIHFIDSGNYHYISSFWLEKIRRPVQLVVFDNHHDMQPPAFGDILSCGGWIDSVLKTNVYVQRVIIIGVNGELTESLGEYVTEYLRTGRVEFITRQELECGRQFLPIISNADIYLSIDKDVLDVSEVRTNWDQGNMSFEFMCDCIDKILDNNTLIGADICGEPAMADCDRGILAKSEEVNVKLLSRLIKYKSKNI